MRVIECDVLAVAVGLHPNEIDKAGIGVAHNRDAQAQAQRGTGHSRISVPYIEVAGAIERLGAGVA